MLKEKMNDKKIYELIDYIKSMNADAALDLLHNHLDDDILVALDILANNEFKSNTMKGKMNEAIDLLKKLNINGCITGSSMIDGDYDNWESQPDIDLFVYAKPQLQYAANMLIQMYGFTPLNAGEQWKINRLNNYESKKKMPVETLKIMKDGIIVNISYKENKTNIFDVLASFDMSIIMVGYDIKKHVLLDLRCGWANMVREDEDNRWSPSINIAYPNPLRDQDVDMYGVQMWVRQFDRVIKYWNRGYDTRPMAKFYIKLIDGVLETGKLFSTEKGEVAFNAFVETYEPLKNRMVEWLKDKEDC